MGNENLHLCHLELEITLDGLDSFDDVLELLSVVLLLSVRRDSGEVPPVTLSFA